MARCKKCGKEMGKYRVARKSCRAPLNIQYEDVIGTCDECKKNRAIKKSLNKEARKLLASKNPLRRSARIERVFLEKESINKDQSTGKNSSKKAKTSQAK